MVTASIGTCHAIKVIRKTRGGLRGSSTLETLAMGWRVNVGSLGRLSGSERNEWFRLLFSLASQLGR